MLAEPTVTPETVAVVPAPDIVIFELVVLHVPPAVGSLTVIELPMQTEPGPVMGAMVANEERVISNMEMVSRILFIRLFFNVLIACVFYIQ